MQKSDVKEPVTIPYQLYIFDADALSKALGKQVLSISNISAKCYNGGLSADVMAVCKSTYSSVLTMSEKVKVFHINAKEDHKFIHISYGIDGNTCKIAAFMIPTKTAITTSRAM